MKSANTRTPKKKSAAATASLRNTINDVPTRKLTGYLNQEHRDITIFQIREEIMDKVFDKCYEIYLDRQSVLFTGYCAYLAWKQLFQWAFFPRDPGEINYTDSTKWIPDKPPEPSPRDTWAGYSMPVIQKPQVEHKYAFVNENDLKDPCEIAAEATKVGGTRSSFRSHHSSNYVPKEPILQLQEKSRQNSLSSKTSQKSQKLLTQHDPDESMFSKIKVMSYHALPRAPPPQDYQVPQPSENTKIDHLLLNDPTVSPPRKLHHDAFGSFRFVSALDFITVIVHYKYP